MGFSRRRAIWTLSICKDSTTCAVTTDELGEQDPQKICLADRVTSVNTAGVAVGGADLWVGVPTGVAKDCGVTWGAKGEAKEMRVGVGVNEGVGCVGITVGLGTVGTIVLVRASTGAVGEG